jgi:outer membrane immunogenic protein
MRRLLFTTISLLALTATSAFAADLPRAMPTKAPAVFSPQYNWTGFYVGINGGYGWGKLSWSAFGSDADPSGGLVGGTVGYNWQTGPWVYGLEGDIDWSGIKGSFTSAACPTGCETKNEWLATVRGRLGYAFDRVMPYVTGGLAVGDIKATQAGVGSVSDTNAGWTVGGGVEAALAANWTAKVEYLYADLGDVSCTVCAPATNVDFRTHIVRTGVNLRF